jgi:hypothetical protein
MWWCLDRNLRHRNQKRTETDELARITLFTYLRTWLHDRSRDVSLVPADNRIVHVDTATKLKEQRLQPKN